MSLYFGLYYGAGFLVLEDCGYFAGSVGFSLFSLGVFGLQTKLVRMFVSVSI